jgi:hypothetical protein
MAYSSGGSEKKGAWGPSTLAAGGLAEPRAGVPSGVDRLVFKTVIFWIGAVKGFFILS